MAEITENTAEETIVENQNATNETTATTAAETTETKVEETVAETATETKASETVAETKTEITPAETTPKKTFEELAKEFGYESDLEILSQAKEQIQKKKEEDERPYKETEVFAEVVKYAGENKLAQESDFIENKKLNSEKDEVLAFNKYKAEYKPTEDEKELEPTELAAAIQDKFNELYDLDSDNERLKKAGLAEIKEIADEIRKPLNEKIQDVHNKMLNSEMGKQHVISIAEFNKNVQKLSTTIKDNEGKEIVVEAEIIPTIEAKEVEELFKSEAGLPVYEIVANAFKQSRELGDKAFGGVLENLHQQKVKAIELQLTAQNSYNLGLEKGKSLGVGAKAPFNSKEITTDTANEAPLRQYGGGKFV